MTPLPINKSKWGPGPWQDEPDRIEWDHLGFPCLMTRAPIGNWCGYVAIPKDHPFYEINYFYCTQIPPCRKFKDQRYCDHAPEYILDVHGGLTYAGHCQGHICHTPKPGESDNVWWFGFDCANHLDLVPSLKPLMIELGHPNPGFLDGRTVYRNVPYVTRQVNGLAQQLHEVCLKPSSSVR